MYAENLKKIRKILNLSVDELSIQIGIPARTIGGYERNERKMALEVVTQLCKKLNVNANWFVTGEGEMFNNSLSSDVTVENIKSKVYNLELILKQKGII